MPVLSFTSDEHELSGAVGCCSQANKTQLRSREDIDFNTPSTRTNKHGQQCVEQADFSLKFSKMSRNEQRMKLFEIFKVFLRKTTLEKRFKKRISEKE